MQATTYTYDPFGNVTVNGADTNPYQFTGRENDAMGLYYYRARYYSPTLQRFVSQDPAEFAAGDANLYGYVNENPTTGSDATGLCKGKDGKKPCIVPVRTLRGNGKLVGSPRGGFSGNTAGNIPVTPDSAAVAPSEWGGKGLLRPNIGDISGEIYTSYGTLAFNDISDVIGPPANQLKLLIENPGEVLIELPSMPGPGPGDFGDGVAIIWVPDSQPCPAPLIFPFLMWGF